MARILLLVPLFYDVEKKIKSVLEKSGNEVIWINNKILPFDYRSTESKFKIIRRFYFFLLSPLKRYLKKELRKIENLNFDLLFSINGHIICGYLFKRLRENNPQLHSVLFIWDSFTKYSLVNEIKYFDRVYTFDHSDAEKYKIKYKPNFYIKYQSKKDVIPEHDLCFAGKFSPGRLSITKKIINQIEEAGVNYFIILWPAYKNILHNRLLNMLFKRINFNSEWNNQYLINYEANESLLDEKIIVRNCLSYEEVQSHSQNSNVILDLIFEKQNGYTHRLIEAIANGKKVITTNQSIKNERYYNPSQIKVLDEKNQIIDCEWTKSKAKFPIDNYFKDLELSEWLGSILNMKVCKD